MSARIVSPDQINQHVAADLSVEHAPHNTPAARVIRSISTGYKTALAGMDRIDTALDNPLGRVTGMAYYAKTAGAVIGAFKDVKTEGLINKLHNDAPVGKRMTSSARQVAAEFHYPSVVAAGLYFGKGAAIFGGLELAASAINAPILASAFVAGGLTKAAMWALSTHQGHHFEHAVGDKVGKHVNALVNLRAERAKKPPEPQPELHSHHAAAHHGHDDHHHAHANPFKREFEEVKAMAHSAVEFVKEVIDHPGEKLKQIAEDVVTGVTGFVKDPLGTFRENIHGVTAQPHAVATNDIQLSLVAMKANGMEMSVRPHHVASSAPRQNNSHSL